MTMTPESWMLAMLVISGVAVVVCAISSNDDDNFSA